MARVGPTMWMFVGLTLMGFAIYSYAQDWKNGVMWKVLGGLGFATAAYGWYKRGQMNSGLGLGGPSAVAGYKAGPGASGIPEPTAPLQNAAAPSRVPLPSMADIPSSPDMK